MQESSGHFSPPVMPGMPEAVKSHACNSKITADMDHSTVPKHETIYCDKSIILQIRFIRDLKRESKSPIKCQQSYGKALFATCKGP